MLHADAAVEGFQQSVSQTTEAFKSHHKAATQLVGAQQELEATSHALCQAQQEVECLKIQKVGQEGTSASLPSLHHAAEALFS